MHVLTDMNDKALALVMDKKEAQALIMVVAAAMKGEKLNKRSAAYKLAQQIEDELPVY